MNVLLNMIVKKKGTLKKDMDLYSCFIAGDADTNTSFKHLLMAQIKLDSELCSPMRSFSEVLYNKMQTRCLYFLQSGQQVGINTFHGKLDGINEKSRNFSFEQEGRALSPSKSRSAQRKDTHGGTGIGLGAGPSPSKSRLQKRGDNPLGLILMECFQKK